MSDTDRDAADAAAAAPEDAGRIDRLYRAKARAELAAADGGLGSTAAVASIGSEIAAVLLVKGEPSSADLAAGRVLEGADGAAAAKALEALGVGSGDWYALCSRAADAPAPALVRRLELAVEAVDPKLVVALDAIAARDLADAFGLADLPPGRPVTARGRTLGAVAGFGASLDEPARKALVWRQLRAVAAAAGLAPRA